MDFYERLNFLIKSRGLSQKKVETALGFSNGAISKWKKYSPNAEKVQLLAQYFNVSFNYLMGSEEKETESSVYYNKEETAQAAQKIFEDDKVLFDVYRSADKDRLIEYAKRLKALRDMEEGNS